MAKKADAKSWRFRKISSYEPVAEYLADRITESLSNGQKVLWLVAGGSSTKVAVGAVKLLKNSLDLANLTITLTDERYGPVGHPDSNWQQLMEVGFSLPGARLIPVLSGKDIATTAISFAAELEQQLSSSDYKIGLFGMGADGHTSGILPGSSALNSDKLADYYQGPDYSRITTTEKAITRLDEVVLYSVGEEKRPVIERLASDAPKGEQPAQILKKVPKLTIFNDFKGGEA